MMSIPNLTLRVVEVRWHGDDCIGDLAAKICLCASNGHQETKIITRYC